MGRERGVRRNPAQRGRIINGWLCYLFYNIMRGWSYVHVTMLRVPDLIFYSFMYSIVSITGYNYRFTLIHRVWPEEITMGVICKTVDVHSSGAPFLPFIKSLFCVYGFVLFGEFWVFHKGHDRGKRRYPMSIYNRKSRTLVLVLCISILVHLHIRGEVRARTTAEVVLRGHIFPKHWIPLLDGPDMLTRRGYGLRSVFVTFVVIQCDFELPH